MVSLAVSTGVRPAIAESSDIRPTGLTDPSGLDPNDPCGLAQIESLRQGIWNQIRKYLVGEKPPTYGTAGGHSDYFDGLRTGLARAVQAYRSAGCDESKLPQDIDLTLQVENPWMQNAPTGNPVSPITLTPPDTTTTIIITDISALLLGLLVLRGGGGGYALIGAE